MAGYAGLIIPSIHLSTLHNKPISRKEYACRNVHHLLTLNCPVRLQEQEDAILMLFRVTRSKFMTLLNGRIVMDIFAYQKMRMLAI